MPSTCDHLLPCTLVFLNVLMVLRFIMHFQCLLLIAACALVISHPSEDMVISAVSKAAVATARCNEAAADHEAAITNMTTLQKAIANLTATVNAREPEVAEAQEALSLVAGRLDKAQKIYDLTVAIADIKQAVKTSVINAANADVAFDAASAKRKLR